MFHIIKITKKVLLLITYLFFSVYLSSGLHAKDSLPAIKNDTPWEITFRFNWTGCGYRSQQKGCVKDTSPSNHPNKATPHSHHSNIKIQPGQTYTFKRGCINSCDNKNTIIPYHIAKHYWMHELALQVTTNRTTLVCGYRDYKSLCSWSVNRNRVPVLKYGYPKGIKTSNGFYWDISNN